MRKLNSREKGVALALSDAVGSPTERNQLLRDIKNSHVEDLAPDGSILRFYIKGYERPPFHGQDTFRGEDNFPVEGLVNDGDGGEIDVLLFSDINGRILELELIKHMGGSVVGPDWDSFRLK